MMEDDQVNTSSTITESQNSFSTESKVKPKSKELSALKPLKEEYKRTLSWKNLKYWIPLIDEHKALISDKITGV